MDDRFGLDDPAQAAFAWRRFRQLLGWVALTAAVAILVALTWLGQSYGPLSWIAMLATVFGVGGSVLLAGCLMGLVFLSAGTGHDAAVDGVADDLARADRHPDAR